jgi:hypothetical protein
VTRVSSADPRDQIPPGLLAEGKALILDVAAGEAVGALREEGIRSLLLKGKSFDQWLYEDDARRRYSDVDLLVSPGDHSGAEAVLLGLGYEKYEDEDPFETHPHAQPWMRPGGAFIDLHTTLLGSGVSHEVAWSVLSRDVETIDIRGVTCEVLSVPGRLVNVCLHAAQHAGITPNTIEDLERALARASESEWEAAAGVAAELGATSAFVAGLQLSPQGPNLVERLRLGPVRDVSIDLRRANLTEAELRVALTWEELKAQSGRKKVRLLWRRLFPPADYMRAWCRATGRRTRRRDVAFAYLARLVRNVKSARRGLAAGKNLEPGAQSNSGSDPVTSPAETDS